MKHYISLDKAVRVLAKGGIPVLVFLIAVALNPFTGAAAITTALVMIGPAGLIGGIVSLIGISLLSGVVAEYGIETLIKNLIKHFRSKGYTDLDIVKTIRDYPLSDGLKLKCARYIERLQKSSSDHKETFQ